MNLRKNKKDVLFWHRQVNIFLSFCIVHKKFITRQYNKIRLLSIFLISSLLAFRLWNPKNDIFLVGMHEISKIVWPLIKFRA